MLDFTAHVRNPNAHHRKDPLLKFVTKRTGVIIPMYIYPTDIYNNTDYDGICDLAKTYNTVNFIIIINPDSGPGTVVDGNYTVAIKALHGACCNVIGYVSTNYTAENIDDVKTVIDTWIDLYPEIDGIFLDEMTNDDDSTHAYYYKELKDYAHNKNLYPVIGNPGSQVEEIYYLKNAVDIVIVHENSVIPTESDLRGGAWAGSNWSYPFTMRAGLLYDQSTLDIEVLNLMKKYLNFIYITDDALPNPWDSVSSYLETILEILGNQFISYSGMSTYNKAVSLQINTINAYHAYSLISAGDVVAGLLKHWSFNAGRVVDSDIVSALSNGAGTPIVRITTSAAHNLTTGDIVNLTNSGVAGYNTKTYVTVINSTTFDCDNIPYTADENPSAINVKEPAYLQCDLGYNEIYKIEWTLSGSSTIASKLFKFEPVQNITHVDKAASESTFTNTTIQMIGGTCLLTVNAGDRIWFQCMELSGGTTDFIVKHLNFALIRAI